MKKAMAIILSAALALTMASCTIKSPSTVMNVAGTEVPAGVYLYYQFVAASNAAAKVEDTKKDIYKQEIEGKKAEQWIHDETLKSIKSYIYVDKAFADNAAFKLSDDTQKEVDNQVEGIWEQSEKLLAANGIGKESLSTVVEHSAKREYLYSESFVKDSANAVSDDAAKAYMDENYSHVTGLTLPIVDTSYKTLPEDKIKEIKAIADAVLADINGGKKLEEASAKEALNKTFAITGHEMSDELFTSLFTTEYLRKESTNMPKEVLDAVLAAKVGDSGVQTANDMPYVWTKIANFEKAEEFETYKLGIVNEVQAKAFEDSIVKGTEGYEVKENASAVNKYSPKKIKQVK